MNKIRRIILTITLFVLAFSMSGCGDAIPELTKEQHDEVCEYAANLLLSYDKNYKQTVLDDKSVEEEIKEMQDAAELKLKVEEQKRADAEAKNNKDKEKDKDKKDNQDSQSTENTKSTTIHDFLGLNGVTIDYADYVVCDVYPDQTTENDWQGLCRATGSNKLVVFRFNMTNNTGADYKLDMNSYNPRFTFKVNGNLSKSAITTLLTNDLMMFRDEIKSGETIQSVVIIELSGADADNLSSVVMKMKANGNLAELVLF